MSSPAAHLFAGLAESFTGRLRQEHERQREDDYRAKQQDHELLMYAYKAMQPDLTPSQASMLMEKAAQIWSPKKDAKTVSEKLKELFGGSTDRYEPQSDDVLRQVREMPRRMEQQGGTETLKLPDVPIGPTAETEMMPQMPDALRTGFSVPGGTVEMPKPPRPEMTYRERELSDDVTRDAARQGAMQTRQLEVERLRTSERSKLETAKFQNRLRALDATAKNREMLKLNQRTRQIAANPESPTGDERAEAQRQLNEENDLKQQQIVARIDAMESNEEYKRSLISQGWARIETGLAALTDNRRRTWSDSQYKRLRTEIGAKNSEIDRITGLFRSSNATPEILEGYQKEVQKLIIDRDGLVQQVEQKLGNEGEQYFPYQSPEGVPRMRGSAPRKSTSVKLTEAEIRAAGGTDADVAEAKRKGVLAQ